jgi:hypothetical protein
MHLRVVEWDGWVERHGVVGAELTLLQVLQLGGGVCVGTQGCRANRIQNLSTINSESKV